MLNHNTSLYKHKISIPILAEISSLAPNKLRKIYRQIIGKYMVATRDRTVMIEKAIDPNLDNRIF